MRRRRGLTMLLAGLVAGSLGCGRASSLFEKPRVGYQEVEVGDVGYAGLTARFVLVVDNQNAIGIDLAQLGYRLTVDGRRVAEGASPQTMHVPPDRTGELTVPIGLSFAELGAPLDALFARKQLPFQLHAELGFGTPLGVQTVAVDGQGVLPVPQPPRVTLVGAALGEVTATRAAIELTVDVANDNPFGVPLAALRYRLSANDEPVATGTLPALQLRANARQTVHAVAGVDLLAIGTPLVGAIVSRAAHIELTGDLELGGFRLPLRLGQPLH